MYTISTDGQNRGQSSSRRAPSFSKNRGGFRSGGSARRVAPVRGKRKFAAFDVEGMLRTKKSTSSTPVADVAIRHTFADFGFGPSLQKNLAAKNYIVPTPIQDQAIPFALLGRDVVGRANTGTGKTAAFLLPLIEKIGKSRGERVLILAPTRELAQQIDKEFRGFATDMRLRSALCVGGMPINAQIRDLSYGPNFVIGTPGRIADLAERGKIVFAKFQNIVLDEVDHMLDMGFIDPITKILKAIAPVRQSLFFSATMPENIRTLVSKFTTNPEHIEIASRTSVESIDQSIVKVRDEAHKFSELSAILSEPDHKKAIIFTETKRSADRLARDLSRAGFPTECIHGDKRQRERMRALSHFEAGRVRVLVATSVAARGIDIRGITHVINYTVPQTREDYTHRIGRTGRGSDTGKAITFVS